MTELSLIDCFSQVGNHFEIFNQDEFGYICGSVLVIRTFSIVSEKRIKILKSEESGFNCFCFNRTTNILVTSEGGKNTKINIYYYNYKTNDNHDTVGFSSNSFKNDDKSFIKLDSIIIEDSLKSQHISLSKNGKVLGILFNEPIFEVKMYDLSELIDGIPMIIASQEYGNIKFGGINHMINIIYLIV